MDWLRTNGARTTYIPPVHRSAGPWLALLPLSLAKQLLPLSLLPSLLHLVRQLTPLLLHEGRHSRA